MSKVPVFVVGLVVCALLPARTAIADATVEITSDVATVAEGESITFTVTVTPSTYVQKVILTYEGEQGQDEDTTAPYVLVHQFDTPGDDITVTATVEYTNGDPDGQDTLDADVVGLTLLGNSAPWRAWPVGYLVQSNPAGKAIDQFNWTYAWSGGSNVYQDNDANDDDKSTWSGKMVVNGTLSCSATVSGVPVSKSLAITITPRNWTVPISCAQDNEPDWGSEPVVICALGEHRDRDSNIGLYIFVPRNGPTDFSPARTIQQVTLGPCEGWWYVSSSILKCQQETAINKYIKDGGPKPSGASENFYDKNDSDCFDYYPSFGAGEFVQAVKNHEYRGTPDTYKSIEGHHGRVEKSIRDDGYDAKAAIEPLTSRSQSTLEDAIDNAISDNEDSVFDFASDESYMDTYGPNWGGYGALGLGGHSRWDPNTTSWTICNNEPTEF